MSESQLVQPKISLLSAEQIEQIHAYALKILATTGVRVDSPQACQLFASRLGSAALEGNRVRIPPEAVEWALKAAPSTIDIYNRGGELAFRLGEGRTRFGIGVTTLFYQDPLTDEVAPFARRHMQEMVRLGSALRHFDVISTVGVIQDVPTQVSDLYESLEMVANTTKPLVILVSDEKNFPSVLDMLEGLHGDLAEKPFVIPYFNPVTPLILNQGTVDKMPRCHPARSADHLLQLLHGGHVDAHYPSRDAGSVAGRAAGRTDPRPADERRRTNYPGHLARLLRYEDHGKFLRSAKPGAQPGLR